jgi:UDP-N-acetylglucosamine 3-dehydrogenase
MSVGERRRAVEAADTLRVGIVGFGGAGIAQLGHFTAMPETTVSAIFDPKDGGRARARAAAPRALVTGDFREFMASAPDAIAVCSPDATHADYVVAAIEAGIHVVCEKPLTDSLEGCRTILRAEAAAPHVVAAVQHQMRFLPVHQQAKQLIASGILGTLSYIEGYYVHNLTRRASLYDDWRFRDNATPSVYAGCHFIDLLRWLLNDEVDEVIGMANHAAFPEYPESDLNVLLLRFRSGVIGKVVVAFGAGRGQDHSLRVYGSEHCIENNVLFAKDGSHVVFARPHLAPNEPKVMGSPRAGLSLRGRGYWWRLQSALPRWRQRLPRYRTYAVGRLAEWLMKHHGDDPGYEVLSYPIRLYPHDLAVRASLQNFVAAIRGTEPVRCTLVDSARTVVTCLAGVEAYRTGRIVKVERMWLSELNGHSHQTDATVRTTGSMPT